MKMQKLVNKKNIDPNLWKQKTNQKLQEHKGFISMCPYLFHYESSIKESNRTCSNLHMNKCLPKSQGPKDRNSGTSFCLLCSSCTVTLIDLLSTRKKHENTRLLLLLLHFCTFMSIKVIGTKTTVFVIPVKIFKHPNKFGKQYELNQQVVDTWLKTCSTSSKKETY